MFALAFYDDALLNPLCGHLQGHTKFIGKTTSHEVCMLLPPLAETLLTDISSEEKCQILRRWGVFSRRERGKVMPPPHLRLVPHSSACGWCVLACASNPDSKFSIFLGTRIFFHAYMTTLRRGMQVYDKDQGVVINVVFSCWVTVRNKSYFTVHKVSKQEARNVISK